MFKIGDRIVHPLHGAGVIDSIEERKVGGTVRKYYVLKLPFGGLVVLIPVDLSESVGVRPLMSPAEIEKVLKSVRDMTAEMTQNWNKRYRENMLYLKSGKLREVARVIKGLISRDRERGLSTGERKMLHLARQILISEMVLSENLTFEEVEAKLNCVFA